MASARPPGGGKNGGRSGSGSGSVNLKDDLIRIVYGYGDAKEPVKESVELLERMVHEYVGEMCRQAYDVALMGMGDASQQQQQQQQRPPPPPPQQGQQAHAQAPEKRKVETGDFIFLIRKDVRRYKRMKDLLEADEELREARDPKLKKLTETDEKKAKK